MAALLVGPPMVGAPEPGLSSSLPWVLVVVLVVVAVVVTVVAVVVSLGLGPGAAVAR